MMFDVAAIGEGAFSVWEAEGRVTLDGAEMELCQECKAPSITTARTAPRTVKTTAWR